MATLLTNNAEVTDRLRTIFSKMFKKSLVPELRFHEFGMKQSFPENDGGYTIRWWRPRQASTTGINTAAIGANEATDPATDTAVAVGYGEATLALRFAQASISNVLRVTDLVDTLTTYTQKMSEDAALDLDTVCRNALMDAASALSAGTWDKHVRFAGADNSDAASAETRFNAWKTSDAAVARMSRLSNIGMQTQLSENKVPMIGGNYVCLVPPRLHSDMRTDTTLVAAMTNSDPGKLYKNADIELDGVVFVKHNNPRRLAQTWGEQDQSSGANYGAVYVGRDAFVVPDISGKLSYKSPYHPKVTILAEPDKSDLHNLKTMLGWKCLYTAKSSQTNEATDPPYFGVLWCKSAVLTN